MANQNPIYLNQQEQETDFIIPAMFLNTNLLLTISISVLSPGWQYVPSHQLFLNANDLFPQAGGDPTKILLGAGNSIIGKNLLIMSSISKIFPAGGATTPTQIKFGLRIFTSTNTIENFEIISGIENPSQFNALIKFKTAP